MNYYDTISYFEYVQDVMLDKVNEMEKLYDILLNQRDKGKKNDDK